MSDNMKTEWIFDTEYFMSQLRDEIRNPNASLRDLEDMTGISASTLSRIENGKLPSLETILTICSRLELEPGRFFEMVTWQKVIKSSEKEPPPPRQNPGGFQ